MLEVKRAMGGFDDLGGAVVLAYALDERFLGFPVTFGEEDVPGAPKIGGRLAQRATRKEEFVAKGRLAIDQANIQTMAKMEILHAVIEDQDIGLEFAHGVQRGADPILVHHDGNI